MMKISTLLFICALGLSGTAAYYSIVGLATIFSSAFVPVVIMTGILEISKLVVASWLYHNWKTVNGLIRTYLTAAVVILMMITSLGIFGFLSKAHVEQNLNNTDARLKMEQIDSQVESISNTVNRYQSQLTQLDRAINAQLDANRTTQAMAARRQQQAERDQIRQKLDEEQARLQELGRQRTEQRQRLSVLESEVGPIRYVAEFFASNNQVDLEKSVRWMIMILVMVFDPLAVLMLIASNMSFDNESNIKNKNNAEVNAAVPCSPTIATSQPIVNIDTIAIGLEVAKQVEQCISAMIVPSISKEEIKDTVKSSMDEWLTIASRETQAVIKEESTLTTVDEINDTFLTDHPESPSDQEPEEPTDVTPPATPPQPQPAVQEVKPSWL
jgi:hypothetical protein